MLDSCYITGTNISFYFYKSASAEEHMYMYVHSKHLVLEYHITMLVTCYRTGINIDFDEPTVGTTCSCTTTIYSYIINKCLYCVSMVVELVKS